MQLARKWPVDPQQKQKHEHFYLLLEDNSEIIYFWGWGVVQAYQAVKTLRAKLCLVKSAHVRALALGTLPPCVHGARPLLSFGAVLLPG